MPSAEDTAAKHNIHLDDDGEEKFVNDYEVIGEPLGEGAFGKVVRVVHTREPSRTNYAMKCMSQSRLRRQRQFQKEGRRVKISTALDDVQREIAIMKKIRHPNIVQLKEVIRDDNLDRIYMVVDLVQGGQIMTWNGKLKEYRRLPTDDYFGEDEARLLFRDIVLGVEYLHRQGVVHRDLKPENLLRTGGDDSIHVKIADFGVSYMFEDDEDNDSTEKKVKGTKGTFQFQSPQALSAHGTWFDPFAADIWALGVNLYAFVFGKLPWFDSDIEILSGLIVDENQKYPLTVPENASPELVTLLKGLLERDPVKRLTMDQIKDDPWVNGGGLVPLSSVERVSPVDLNKDDVEKAFTKLIAFQTSVTVVKAALDWRNKSRKTRETRELENSKAIETAIAKADSEKREAEGTSKMEEQQLDKPDASSDSSGCCCVLQ